MKLQRLLFLLPLVLAVFGTPAAAVEVRSALKEYLPFPSLELRCVADEKTINLPIPQRWKLNAATLNLHYTVSTSIIGKLSNLVVRINNVPIAQMALTSTAASAPLKIAIPVKELASGYNKLSFHVTQHRQERECEPPCASDLWTSIKLDTSSIDYDYDLREVPLQLGSLGEFVFDPRLAPSAKVHLVFDTLSDQSASLAAVVASGVSRRFDYRRVEFSVSDTLLPGFDNVVIGTQGFVARVLGKRAPAPTTGKGGYLKVLPMSDAEGNATDTLHALVLATGETQDNVKLAAETLAAMSIGYPGSDEMRAVGFSLPDIPAYGGRNVISADKAYEFATLNQPTETLAGLNPQPISLRFRLPADFLIKQNRTTELLLTFAYGAGMRADSVLNVLVNKKSVRAIPLQNTEGGFIDGYKIEIPTYVFAPGDNEIVFSPELHITSRECDLIQSGNLFLTLFETSTLRFPYMPHFVEMPKLELFMLNGFPFTRWPDGFEGTIYIAQPSVDTLAAAMNVIGLMTQKNGFPLMNMAVTYKEPKALQGDLIVIGDLFSLPKPIADASPLRVGASSRIPYPVVRSWLRESSYAFSEQVSKMGSGRGLLMQFESPMAPGRSVLLLAAEGQADVLRLSEALLDPEVQGQIRGDLVLIDSTTDKVRVSAMDAGPRYVTGKMGKVDWSDPWIDRIQSLLYTQTYTFYAVIAALLLALSWLLFHLVRRYRAHRLNVVAGKDH